LGEAGAPLTLVKFTD
jgi:Thioredoxin